MNKVLKLVLFLVMVKSLCFAEENLISYYKFDEGSGIVLIDSGSGGATTDNGTAKVYGGSGVFNDNSLPTREKGKYGYALSFNGTNEYVNLGNSTSGDLFLRAGTGGNAFSITVWIKPSDHGGSTRAVLVNTKELQQMGNTDL